MHGDIVDSKRFLTHRVSLFLFDFINFILLYNEISIEPFNCFLPCSLYIEFYVRGYKYMYTSLRCDFILLWSFLN